jgi:uncharacterized protein (DUF302 family)
MPPCFTRIVCTAFLAFALTSSWCATTTAEEAGAGLSDGGLVKVRSAYPMGETISRLKEDIASKTLMFFSEIDQARLAADAGIKLNPATLLVFGNPALGSQFMTSNPAAGIDWPVRLLVFEDAKGHVWLVYTDFAYIARRHHIVDRDEAFAKASTVIGSIASAVSAK